jgi:hypothetical protein
MKGRGEGNLEEVMIEVGSRGMVHRVKRGFEGVERGKEFSSLMI